MSAVENKTEPTENESVLNKSESKVEPNDTISKVHKLQKRFFEVCGELFKYMEFIGEPMYNLMLEHYFAQYKREYELMNSAEFIEVDKYIEQLKIERDREIESVKLERDKQKKQLDILRDKELKQIDLEKAKLYEELAIIRERELEAIRLEHKEQTAEIVRKKEKLDNEIEILAQTVYLEAKIKASRIIPQTWRRFRFFKLAFGRVCKNEAMIYAEQSAFNEINDYLVMRAQEVMPYSDTEEGEEPENEDAECEPHQMTKREYKRWQKEFEKQLRKEREEAQARIEKIMQEEEKPKHEADEIEEEGETAGVEQTPE